MFADGRQAVILFHASRRREPAAPFMRALPLIIGVANLLFGALVESRLRGGAVPQALYLFCVVECSAVALIAAAVISRDIRDIVLRTRIYPLPRYSHLLFILLRLFREPVFGGVLISGTALIGILFHHSPALIIGIVLYYLATVASLTVILAALSLRLISSSQPASIVGLAVIYILTTMFAMTFLLKTDSVMSMIPVVSWGAAYALAGRVC